MNTQLTQQVELEQLEDQEYFDFDAERIQAEQSIELDPVVAEKQKASFLETYMSVAVNELKKGDIIPYLNQESIITNILEIPAVQVYHENGKNEYKDEKMKVLILDNDNKRIVAYSKPSESKEWRMKDRIKINF